MNHLLAEPAPAGPGGGHTCRSAGGDGNYEGAAA